MTQENNNDSENISNYKRELLDQTFRDSVSTISKEGNRNYVNPQKPVGRLYNLRSYFSYFYLVLFFTLPFIKVEGEPFFLFNVLERKFIFFSKIFWPQDFFIFASGSFEISNTSELNDGALTPTAKVKDKVKITKIKTM